jgi:hypothetical protein
VTHQTTATAARLFTILLLAVTTGCGGAKAKDDQTVSATEQTTAEPEGPPRYVIVHRNSRIHLEPSDDAPYLQYRTPERQEKFDARRIEQAKKRREKEAEAEKERLERERERAKRLRKRRRKLSWKRRKALRERDAERAERRRRRRAEKRLRDIERRAEKDAIEAAHRPFIPFRLLGEKGDWLQLAPVVRGEHPGHCYDGNFGEVDRLAADFWVHRDALVPVVDHRVRITVHQGTEVILLPGVALEPLEEENRYRAFVDGFVLDLEIPPDSVGTEYRPQRPFEAPMTDTVFHPVALAEELLVLGESQPLRFNPYRPMYVTGTLFVGNRFYATTQTQCGEYTVLAEEIDLEPVGRRGATRLTGDAESVEPPFARAGSEVYLPDGTKFGEVKVTFPLGDPTQESQGRKCFRTAVWGSTDAAVTRGLELCFAPSDIELPAPEAD